MCANESFKPSSQLAGVESGAGGGEDREGSITRTRLSTSRAQHNLNYANSSAPLLFPSPQIVRRKAQEIHKHGKVRTAQLVRGQRESEYPHAPTGRERD